MSIKRYNSKTEQWEVEATNKASAISILDLEDNFESKNVEGALRELGESKEQSSINAKQIITVANRLNDHIENHPSGGGSGALPTIESSFNLDSADSQDIITIPIYFVSPNLGDGICYININGIEVSKQTITQGDNNIKIGPLGNGIFKIEIKAKDRGNMFTNKLTWTIVCGGIEINLLSNFNTFIAIGKEVSFDYEIVTNLTEDTYLHLTIDGEEQIIKTSAGKHSQLLEGLGLGIHPVTYYAEVGKYRTISYDVNIVITNSENLYLSSKTKSPLTVVDGNPAVIDYTVSKVSEENFIIIFTLDGVSSTGTIKSGAYTWSSNFLEIGSHTLNITVKDSDKNTASLDFTIQVNEDTEFERVEASKYKLVAWWDASDNKSNLYEDRNVWKDKISGIEGTLHNFNYASNGWMSNLDTKEYWLECNGNAYIEIPYAPFKDNFSDGGTIDILFKTNDVGNVDARVLDITDSTNESLGCFINTYQACIRSENHKSSVTISEDEYIRVTFVIDRDERYGKVYVDGIPTDGFSLTDAQLSNKKILENFAHNGYIYLNSIKGNGYGTCCIKHLRIYDRALTHNEVITLMISDIEDRQEQRKKYNFCFDNKTMPKMYLTFNRSNLDPDKKNKIPLTITYDSPDTENCGVGFSSSRCSIYAQGTSSLGFVIPNFNIVLADDSGADMYYNPFFGTGKEETLFCLKANYMDSSNVNNVALAAIANDLLFDENTYNPAQIKDMQDNVLEKPQVRHTIAGFPIYVYVKDTSQANPEFVPYGVYDFNTDRYSANTFGYTQYEDGQCLSYEAAANTQSGAAAFNAWTINSGKSKVQYYKDEFKLIYPPSREGNDTYDEISKLVEWVDSAGIENFKADLPKHFNVTHLLRYYIFVNVFGLVDSLGKNMKLTSFDGGNIWYPQLYDMDTCLGLNNEGLIKFDVDIEPEHDSVSEDDNTAFNTSASKLWVKLHDFMWDEIKEEYQKLRVGKLTLDNIMHYIYDLNIAKIPETFYAESMQQKYLNFRNDYLNVMHGSRYHHIKKWIRERLLYMDTLLGFDAATSDWVTIRAQAADIVNIGLEPYSPMYVKVKWTNAGDEDSIAYSTVRVRRGETAELESKLDANDQEVMIYGGKYIKRLKNLTTLKPKSMLLSAATKLIDLECHSPILLQLAINECKLLQNVDISGCSSLGTDATGSQVLDLTGCTNLRFVNAYNTQLKSITTDTTGGNLEEIYYPYSTNTIELYNQNGLKTVGLPTEIIYDQEINHSLNKLPTNLIRFKLYNCPNVQTLRKEYSKYNYFTDNFFLSLYNTNIIDIDNSLNTMEQLKISYVNKLTSLGLYNLKQLKTLEFTDLVNGDGKLSLIDISGCDNLENVYINHEQNNVHYPYFANNSTLDLSLCRGLKKLSSNYPIKGLSTIILPVAIADDSDELYSNFKELLFEDTYDTNKKSDIQNIYARYSENKDSIDFKNIELDRLNLQTVDIPTEITNLYLNIKNSTDVNINKYRSSNNRISVEGTYDFSNFEENNMASLFKGMNLTNIALKSSEFLSNVKDLTSCFEGATISDKTNLNAFLSKFNNVTNCYRTFKNANGLINGPTLNTDVVTNAFEMFYGCDKLQSIPTYNLSQVIDASYMFYGCRNLLIDQTLNLLNCINADYMFNGCKKLSDLKFESDNKIATARYIFYNCENLLNLQMFNTKTATTLEYAFYNCKKLSSIPDIQIDALINLAYAFYNCKVMTGTADPNKYWLNSKITEYTLCFANCSKLANFYTEPPEGVPDEWGGLYDNIGENDMEIKVIPNSSSYLVSRYMPKFYSYYRHNLLKTNYSAWKSAENYDICLKEPIAVTSGNTYELTVSSSQYVTVKNVNSNNVEQSVIVDYQYASPTLSFTVPDGCSYINVYFNSSISNIGNINPTLIDTSKENQTLEYVNATVTKTDGSITSDLTSLTIAEADTIYIKFDPETTYIDFERNGYLKSISSIDLSNCPICDNMFINCENLETIDTLNLSNVKSMVNMFKNCLKLKSIGSFDTSLCEDLTDAFYNCTKLEAVPYFDSENVRYIDRAFYNCNSLKAIEYSTLENVYGMYYTFYNCTSLESLGVLNTSKSENFNYTFAECRNLITIESLDVSNSVSMENTFYNCRNLTSSLYLDTQKATTLRSMFYNCSSLKSLAYLDITNAINIYGLFDSCKNLLSVPILNYSKITDMTNVFNGCASIKEITLANTENVESMYRTFNGCRSLITITGLDTSKVKTFTYTFYSCIALTKVSVDVKNAENMNYMFDGCSGLTELKFVNSTVNAKSMDSMFANCSNLTETPALNTSNCTSVISIYSDCTKLVNAHLDSWNIDTIKAMAYMLRNCVNISQNDLNTLEGWSMTNVEDIRGLLYGTSITTFNVNNWSLYNVQKISYLFANCTNLISIIGISSLVTENITNLVHMFDGCTSLVSLDLSNWKTINVTDIQYIFYKCSSLTNLKVNTWNVSNVTNFYNAFYGCGLTALDLSNWDLSSAQILQYMFGYCDKLESIKINTHYSGIKDMQQMFAYCTSLVTIPETFYLYGEANSAFNNCSSLKNISNIIIDCDTNIVDYLFYNCSSLETIESLVINSCGSVAFMFDECIKLQSINNLSITTADPISLESMFSGCRELLSIAGTINNILNTKNTFNSCLKLQSVDLSNWNLTNCTNTSYMFSGCYALTTVTCNGTFGTSKVQDVSYMFYNCRTLTSVPFIELDSCTKMSSMFYNCYALTEIADMQTKGFATDKVTNMDGAFYECRELLYFPSLKTTSVVSIARAFYNCSKMVGTPSAIDYWNRTPAINSYANCFYNCKSLTNYNTEIQASWKGTGSYSANDAQTIMTANYTLDNSDEKIDILNKINDLTSQIEELKTRINEL